MEMIIKPFRAYLQTLIEDEQQRRRFDTKAMLAFMQCNAALPEFYREPAQQSAAEILSQSAQQFPDGTLAAELQEAIKAVYGAWIREHFRTI
jgi:hypothetical protein